MHIDPAQARGRQATSLDQCQDFVVIARFAVRQRAQPTQNFATFAQLSAGQLSDYEGVRDDAPLLKPRRQARMAASQMLDPERSVDQH